MLGVFVGVLLLGTLDESVKWEMVVSAGASVVILAWAIKRRREVVTLLRTPSTHWIAIAAAGGAITYFCATAAIGIVTSLIDIPEIYFALPYLDAGYSWWVVILVVCVQPAVIEELLFRGLLYDALGTILNTAEVVAVTALLFMMIHFAVASFPHLLLVGFALGGLRAATGSIWPCMTLHFVHNALCVVTEPGAL